MVSCYAGTVKSDLDAVPLGQRVADELGVSVLAPTARVGTQRWAAEPQPPGNESSYSTTIIPFIASAAWGMQKNSYFPGGTPAKETT